MTAAESPIVPVKFEAPRAIEPEDQARADYYALLANLFYRAPDARLLQAIAIAEPPSGVLAPAWQRLADASNVVPEDAVHEEYDAVFVGVGKPPVMLYGSFYMAGFMMEKPLAALRQDLGELGFVRAESVREPEDHLAAICDVMRAMILGDLENKPQPVEAQKAFFLTHVKPWIFDCVAAISAYHQANFYRHVAGFAKSFFEVEIEAFEIE
ncbi:MAG: molecular chaperone TorD family protein [Rhodocyclaceae bacterium]|nr:molecular chaperone TorD family protein [Rhodocyclaceae bacterium]MCA3023794.1 molecular chaperone TorD family protein [Rhodocyclaceae bacterium]MCA3030627.1 molecular chaperone TorD family protein [Rhodocyclaceae bacterium]MCA3035781.1 molecular chaperone TorD family protein [Rhodocyclaceae bacterium]MCA3040900.1 molecular chaperone TorD family protein [Rhodocyclaceae bacterium]